MDARTQNLRATAARSFAALEQAADDREAMVKTLREVATKVEGSRTIDDDERYEIIARIRENHGVIL